MSIKTLLVASAASIAVTAAFAGGVSSYAAPAPAATSSNTGVYVEANLGYAKTYYKSTYGLVDSIDHGNGSIAGGLDLGYNFSKTFAAEVGGFYLQHAKVDGAKIKPWNAYVAGKMTVPVAMGVSAFGKVGLGYQKVKYDAGIAESNPALSKHHWGPMFAVGAAYNLTPVLSANVQYSRFAGKESDGVTNPNIYTVGIGYTFAV